MAVQARACAARLRAVGDMATISAATTALELVVGRAILRGKGVPSKEQK
jgi:hypothetical protein